MRILPILFSKDMIPPLLEEAKQRTRRTAGIVDGQLLQLSVKGYDTDILGNVLATLATPNGHYQTVKKAPYRAGDVLYVREDYYAYGYWQPFGLTPTGLKKWKFRPAAAPWIDGPTYRYSTDPRIKGMEIQRNSYRSHGWYKRLGRFMPKGYSRIFLEVTDQRLERLDAIDDHEAQLEGVQEIEAFDRKMYYNYAESEPGVISLIGSPRLSFFTLWSKLNGEESLKANPWVWVISFKQVKRPANFLTPNKRQNAKAH